MLTTADVTFEPKSPWQKDDCIGSPSSANAARTLLDAQRLSPAASNAVRGHLAIPKNFLRARLDAMTRRQLRDGRGVPCELGPHDRAHRALYRGAQRHLPVLPAAESGCVRARAARQLAERQVGQGRQQRANFIDNVGFFFREFGWHGGPPVAESAESHNLTAAVRGLASPRASSSRAEG